MVIIYPVKKPKLQFCEFNYCEGSHQDLKKKVEDIKPNVMLLAALANSMKIRFAQEEKLKKYQEMLQMGKIRTREQNIHQSLAQLQTSQENAIFINMKYM